MPVVRIINGISELDSLVGSEIGVGEWFEIAQDQVTAFADATHDHQWIHVDPRRAADGPYGATVAHGYLTLSLLPFLAHKIYKVSGLRMTVNYGLNKVRFPSPVRVGSRVRDRLTLVSLTPTSQGGQAVFRHHVEIDGEARPGCVAETVSLLIGQEGG